MHLFCQNRCRFGVLKRRALSHTFAFERRIAVNLFTAIVEALTAPESHSTKSAIDERNGFGRNKCFHQDRLARVDVADLFSARAALESAQNVSEPISFCCQARTLERTKPARRRTTIMSSNVRMGSVAIFRCPPGFAERFAEPDRRTIAIFANRLYARFVGPGVSKR